MSRLIDADSAKLSVSDYKIFRCQLGGLMDVAEFIDDQPTIDAIPVVRCGQCKFDNLCCRNVGKDGKRTKDDFCSYGERKEGSDNG